MCFGADVFDTRAIYSESILKTITKRAHHHERKVVAKSSGNWITGFHNEIDAYTHLSDL